MQEAIDHLTTVDPVLRELIPQLGPYEMKYIDPQFEALARSIVYQQLNGKAAFTIFGRLAAALQSTGFTPEGLLALTMEDLRALGLSGQKSKYLRDLAEKTLSGEVDFSCLPGLPDQDVIDMLCKVKGVGEWTAHMFLMFALRRPNILPVGDYGVRVGMQKAYRLRKLPTPERMRKIARKWEPYCSVGSWYMWRLLDGPVV